MTNQRKSSEYKNYKILKYPIHEGIAYHIYEDKREITVMFDEPSARKFMIPSNWK